MIRRSIRLVTRLIIHRKPHFVLLAAISATSLRGQDVVIDWSNRNLVSYPRVVEKEKNVVVRLQKVNNLFYTYDVSVEGTPQAIKDLDEFIKAMNLPAEGGGIAAVSTCNIPPKALKDKVAEMSRVLKEDLDPASEKNKAKACVPLADSLAAVKAVDDTLRALRADDAYQGLSKCDSGTKGREFYEQVENAIAPKVVKLKLLADTPHTLEFQTSLSPNNDYKVTVTESLDGKPTKCSTSFQFSPTSNQLFLSGGILLTSIENRSYSNRAIPQTQPAGSPPASKNYLVVEGTGRFSPAVVGLLNYRFPWWPKELRSKFDLALSSGPVLKLTTSSNTASNFGFFYGASVHLWDRFFITPGFHVGEFADFPIGYNPADRTLPDNFGTPVPLKRWTTRFAIGITYRTADLSKVGTIPTKAPAAKDTATSLEQDKKAADAEVKKLEEAKTKADEEKADAEKTAIELALKATEAKSDFDAKMKACKEDSTKCSLAAEASDARDAAEKASGEANKAKEEKTAAAEAAAKKLDAAKKKAADLASALALVKGGK